MLPSWLRVLRKRWVGLPSRPSRPPRGRPPRLVELEPRVLPSFNPAVTFPAGAAPRAVLLSDLNRDGKLDLISANYNDGTVSVLLGNGDGTFQNAVNVGPFAGPFGVAVGDVNGDGKQDLVVTNAL